MNPFPARWFARRTPADGYEFHQLTPVGDQTFTVALNPEHGRRLLELASSYDLVWATTWGAEANHLISPILGLRSDIPVIDLPGQRTLMSRRSAKAERIVGWVGQRPFAWFDDEINRPTRLWLDNQDTLGRHLAHRVPAEIGLTDTDFDVLRLREQAVTARICRGRAVVSMCGQALARMPTTSSERRLRRTSALRNRQL